MPTHDDPKAAATADQLIRELRALIERRGWVASGSGVDAQGAINVSARPKVEGE